MRPKGEVSIAILRVVNELRTPDHAPTMREIAHRAQVGYKVMKSTLNHLLINGQLAVAHQVRVPHCKRPVNAYELRKPKEPAEPAGLELAVAMSAWGRLPS